MSTTPTASTTKTVDKYGGTLRVGFDRDAVFLGDPIELRQQQDTIICRPAVETLGRYNSAGEVTPWLATSWKLDPDALTMIIHLRKGVTFHDGTPFNAEAVKFNLDRFRQSSRSEIADVASIDVVDEYTVKLNLSVWNSTLEGAVLYFAGYMVSPTAFNAHSKEWAEKNPIGTGPYKFVSWERDVAIKFEKNPNYWQKGKPYLDAIEFVIIADEMVRMASLQRHEVDILEKAYAKDVATLKANDKLALMPYTTAIGMYALVPDDGNPKSPFANFKVRQAVAHAVDSQAMVDNILMGLGMVATQYADPANYGYNPDVKGYAYDVAKAKQLMAEAGYADGFTCTLLAKADPTQEKVITAVQGYLSKIGITGKIDLLTAARFSEVSGTGGWTNALNFIGGRGGPDYSLLIPRYFGPKAYEAWTKTIMHPEGLNDLFDQATRARTQKEKQAAMYKIQQMLFADNLVSIPLFHEIPHGVAYKTVHDQNFFLGDNIWTPEDVWIEK